MQPMLILSAGAPGLAYVNGRVLGALEAGEILSLPVSPRGAVYLELHPTVRGYLPFCGRLTLSSGRVLPESVGEGMRALLWPCGVAEIELAPERVSGPEKDEAADDSDAVRLSDGVLCRMEPLGDTVGHAFLHGAPPSHGTEIVWENGAPHWPQTPEDTALAAAEAVALGLWDEARGYMTPGALARDCLSQLSGYDGCLKMKYCAPESSAVGLVRVLGARCAQVVRADFRASAMGGAQGTWRLDDISVVKSRGD